jgi:uncharacterized cupin superfamily protein
MPRAFEERTMIPDCGAGNIVSQLRIQAEHTICPGSRTPQWINPGRERGSNSRQCAKWESTDGKTWSLNVCYWEYWRIVDGHFRPKSDYDRRLRNGDRGSLTKMTDTFTAFGYEIERDVCTMGKWH